MEHKGTFGHDIPTEKLTAKTFGRGIGTEKAIADEGEVSTGVVEVLPEHREVNIRGLSPTEIFSGDEKGEVNMANFLGADKGNPKYENILEDVDNIVHRSDAQTLVNLVKSNLIHPTVLLRLFEKYADGKANPRNFIKLTDALTELEVLNYELNEELTDNNLARYYAVLKKAETTLKDKAVEAIAVMVEAGKLHKSVLQNLVKEYAGGREAPNRLFAAKVRLALDMTSNESIN